MIDTAKQIQDLQNQVAGQIRKIAELRTKSKKLMAQLTKKKDKDDQMNCPECKSAFARRQQLTKSAQTKARTSISKILRRMYPQDYAS